MDKKATIQFFEIVQKEGNREVSRNVAHYNHQDKLYISDFDELLLKTKKEGEE